MLLNLNEASDKATIKSFITNNLPGRQGRRDLNKALKQNKIRSLTAQMGDRPAVPNVCLILTSAVLDDFPQGNLTQFFGDVCDYVFLLRQGGNKDLQEVPSTLCPSGKDGFVYIHRKKKCNILN